MSRLSLSLLLLLLLSFLDLTEAKVLSLRHPYANLSSPVPGQVLYPGKQFRLIYANEVRPPAFLS